MSDYSKAQLQVNGSWRVAEADETSVWKIAGVRLLPAEQGI
ncbi:hypothetical protein [Marinobacter guineae]|nr:hypothetical protein [Marinobacter guineae]